MKGSGRTLFLDFGTHEASEIRSLVCRSRLSRAWLAKTCLIHSKFRVDGFRNLWAYVWGASLSKAQVRQIDLVMVEPFATRGISDVIGDCAFGSSTFFNSVVSNSCDTFKTLYLAHDSLGHSLYSSKPRLSGRSVEVLNMQISKLIDLLVADGRISGWDKVIVRLNIEGAETEVLDAILSHEDLVDCEFLFMGSLGDIGKCHGEDALKKYEAMLERFERKFVWFTSNPNSWHRARAQIREYLE